MKLSVLPAILVASALGVSALSPERQVLITYPNDTPDSTMNEAKNTIEAAVGFMPDVKNRATDTSIPKGWASVARVWSVTSQPSCLVHAN